MRGQMRTSSCCIMALAAVFSLAFAASPNSKQTIETLELKFTPTQTIGASTPSIAQAMLDKPVMVTFLDQRTGDPAHVGERTDDDGNVFKVKATNDVASYFKDVVSSVIGEWGLRHQNDAPLKLQVSLHQLNVKETRQGVDATFKGIAQIGLKLSDTGTEAAWSGSASGDATRDGKEFSDDNCNEVLSDALLEALVQGFSEQGLHEAWAGTASPSAAAPRTPEPAVLTPERLLEEIQRLSGESVEADTIEAYVRGVTLTRRLSSDDITHWKKLQIPEQIIRTALACKVRAS